MEPFPADVGFGVRVGKNSVHRQKMLIRYAPSWVAVAPPYTVTEDEIDEMVARLRRSIVDVLGELKD
jgi:adenosylmethionine-8-amino-7-oxononanoate aminotransferase